MRSAISQFLIAFPAFVQITLGKCTEETLRNFELMVAWDGSVSALRQSPAQINLGEGLHRASVLSFVNGREQHKDKSWTNRDTPISSLQCKQAVMQQRWTSRD